MKNILQKLDRTVQFLQFNTIKEYSKKEKLSCYTEMVWENQKGFLYSQLNVYRKH